MRMAVSSLMFIVLALLGGIVSAQDTAAPFCGDLSEEDCTLLTEAMETMGDLDSAVFHLDVDFVMSGLPDATLSTLDFQVSGDGAFAVDGDALSAFTLSPETMTENLDELPQMFEEAIQAISADVILVFDIPPELIAQAAIAGVALPDKVSLSARLVEGFAYINLDKLAELDTTGSLPRGWQGLDLAGFYRRTLEQQIQIDVLGEMLGLQGGTLSVFANPDFMARFTTLERLQDTEVDEQRAAVFQTTIDYDALFSDPAVQEALRAQFTNAGTFGGVKPDDAAIDQIMAMYSQMFDGLALEMTQTVGLDDRYIHGIGVHVDWTPNLGSSGAFGSSASTPQMNFLFDLQFDLDHFNDAPQITAPEGATIYPLDLLVPALD